MASKYGYHKAMKSVKISELKNRLSHYLQHVRRGESLLVCDRDRVIARIEPAGNTAPATVDASWLADLERSGTVRRRIRKLPKGWLERRPLVKADVVAALLEEREHGR